MNPGKDAWVGVLGGGQLGRMLSLEARKMGFHILAWTGGDRSGAASTADRIIDKPFEDEDALDEFTSSVEVATIEFENLPIGTLKKVEERIPLRPGCHPVSICQHREKEKKFLTENGFGCANFVLAHDLVSFTKGLSQINSPSIVKTAEFGYDGKGQLRLPKQPSAEEIGQAWNEFDGGRVVIEECITLESEMSVLVARTPEGKIVNYDPVENIHRNHILDLSIVPARIPQDYLNLACETASEIADCLNYVGLLAVEFFVSSDGRLIVNEIAPRPHNSGHHTINACHTSQFEQQVRAVSGFPLGSSKLLSPVIMMNLLGDLWQDSLTPPDWKNILGIKGISLHLYGKRKACPGRKMGHVTIMADLTEDCIQKARSIRKELELPTF